MEIKRNLYVSQLLSKRNNGLVKIITGPRRVGKSYLLSHLYKNTQLNFRQIDEGHLQETLETFSAR